MARLPVCLLWAGDSMVASVSLVTQWQLWLVELCLILWETLPEPA